jgi:DNA-binding beta-propeller fold protein YncE
MGLVVLAVIVLALSVWQLGAQPVDCNKPADEGLLQVPLPGHPFSAIPTADGCTMFVSLTAGRDSQVLVLKRNSGAVKVERQFPAGAHLTGMALSPDGKTLAVANGTGAVLLDAAKLASGANNPVLAVLKDGEDAGSVYAAFSPDGKLLFVSDERSAAITVHNIQDVAAGKGAKTIGQIPVGQAPVGLAFSPDGKLLYSTSEVGETGENCSAARSRSAPRRWVWRLAKAKCSSPIPTASPARAISRCRC